MATDSRLVKFEDLGRRYDKALSWSEFELAYRLVSPPAAPKLDFQPYQAFKITNYETIHHSAYDEGKRVRRLVKIQYVLLSRMSEHTITVEEQWAYSDRDERWFLLSGFPNFR